MVFLIENFRRVLSATSIHKLAPFDYDSHFLKQYFDQDMAAKLDYMEFSQLLQVCEGGVVWVWSVTG